MASPAVASVRFEQPLKVPRVLKLAPGQTPTLNAAPKSVRVFAHGPKTKMWTFGGSFPGPTFEARTGSPVSVKVRNRLPASAGKITLHDHGGHNTTANDGQPSDFLIPHDGERNYEFAMREDGQPERAAFQWYHDHRMNATAKHIWRGLAGMFVMHDSFESSLKLPRGRYDVPLMIADRTFNSHNQLTNPPQFRHPLPNRYLPPSDNVIGKDSLVDGRYHPYFKVRARRYRLRILNASDFQPYLLHLKGGGKMTQVASDGGLMPRSVKRSRILLGPGQRAEVVVDFSKLRGKRPVLESVPRRKPNATQSKDGPLMQFRVARHKAKDPSQVPHVLRADPPLDLTGAVHRTWNLAVSIDPDSGKPVWTINGETYDHHRIYAYLTLGSTEVWTYVNRSAVTHFMHSHDVDFQLISRNGRPPKPAQRGLTDTFKVDPGSAPRWPPHSPTTPGSTCCTATCSSTRTTG